MKRELVNHYLETAYKISNYAGKLHLAQIVWARLHCYLICIIISVN